MILRREHPDKPRADVFIPLGYDRQSGTWKPLTDKHFESESDALRVGIAHMQHYWTEIDQMLRELRVICEHKSFECEGDGVNARMILDNVYKLAEEFSLGGADVLRLGDEPDLDDDVDFDESIDVEGTTAHGDGEAFEDIETQEYKDADFQYGRTLTDFLRDWGIRVSDRGKVRLAAWLLTSVRSVDDQAYDEKHGQRPANGNVPTNGGGESTNKPRGHE